MSPPAAGKPIVPVYRFQKRVLDDPARLIGWLKSRQVGGSFTVTLKMVLDALETGQDWNTMSRSQRQAEKLLKKAAKHVKAINSYVVNVLGRPPIVDLTRIGAQKIVLANEATIEALPCDPDTTAGDTVNWVIDEFPLFPKSEQLFGILKPSIMHGKRLIVLGTPRGRRGKFFDLHEQWQRLGAECGWSWHRTTIEDAIADGFHPCDEVGRPQSYEKFREQEIRDIGEELFLQEYMCCFSDKLISFLPHHLIRACQAVNLQVVRTIESLATCGRELYLGVDVGRRHDLTVIWVVSKTGDTYMTEAVFVLDEAPFAEQERILGSLLATHRVAHCCIDEQGIGMQLAETMGIAFPGLVTPVTFTNTLKSEMAFRLKTAMQSENFWMPKDEDIVADFSSIERAITEGGQTKLSAPRSSSGHGDRFWGAALALHAAGTHRPFELVMAVG